jgi:hypothetical protein
MEDSEFVALVLARALSRVHNTLRRENACAERSVKEKRSSAKEPKEDGNHDGKFT